MSDPPSRLTNLPPTTLDRIISLSLSQNVSPLILISKLGSTISHSTWRVLATTVTLPDDDSILVHLERELESSETTRGTNLLSSIATSHSHLVKHLEIVRPIIIEESFGSEEGLGLIGNREIDFPPLDDHALLSFVERFKNLDSFTWNSYRLPSEDLCFDIANSAKSLRSFRFDLVPSPFQTSLEQVRGDEAPSSPPLAPSSLSPSSSMSLLHSHSSTHTLPHQQQLRWDSPSLSSLPGTLTSLSLSSLSHAGTHELSNSLSSFFALERLELSKTVFVDDSLLQEIAQSLAKTLQWFRIAEMAGTKLSDVGLSSLFEGCQELEEFELDCIEGRLSRSCWSKMVLFPPRLRSIKLIYSESPPHKSWALDHLQSLPSLLSLASLTSFTLSRKLHPACQIPGSHHLARYPIDPLLNPRKITTKELEAITDEGGKRWRELDLDFVVVDQEQLKKVLEKCTQLRKLKVCFDGEFKNLLSLASSFAACFHLYQFLVSIPLHHTPSLQPLTPQTYNPSLLSSPTLSSSSPSSSPSKPLSPELPSNPNSNLPECISSLLPATRDWRRFLKKTHSLQSIDWIGRGGIGRFRFGRIEGKGLMRIQFEPTRPLQSSNDEAGGRRREREDSFNSIVSSRGSEGWFGSEMGSGRRRSSAGGNTTMSSSPGSPGSKMVGKVGGERYGSIDAAFSGSPSPRRKTEGFGAIGPGGGRGTRRCSSTSSSGASSVIGQGWSGFTMNNNNTTTKSPRSKLMIPETGGGQFDPFASSSPTASTRVPSCPTSKSISIGDSLGSGLQMNMGVWNDQPSSSLGYGWASNTSSPTSQKTMDRSNTGGGSGQASPVGTASSKSPPSPTSTRRSSGTAGGVGVASKNGNLKDEGKEGGERRKRDQRGAGGRKKESGAGKA